MANERQSPARRGEFHWVGLILTILLVGGFIGVFTTLRANPSALIPTAVAVKATSAAEGHQANVVATLTAFPTRTLIPTITPQPSVTATRFLPTLVASPTSAPVRAVVEQRTEPIVIEPASLDYTWANSVCNDGTPMRFILRLSPVQSSDWVFAIEGEGFCTSLEDCRQRAQDNPQSVTTLPYPHGTVYPQPLEGLLSNDRNINPLFYQANHVYIPYCSSDLWTGILGGRPQTNADLTETWYFRGRYQLFSVLKALLTDGVVRDEVTTRLLVVGIGQGGSAVPPMLEHIENRMPIVSERRLTKVILDGSWLSPTIPSELDVVSYTDELQRLNAGLAFWRGDVTVRCFTQSGTQTKALCLLPNFFYTYLAVDFTGTGLLPAYDVLIQQSLRDPVHGAFYGVELANPTTPQTIELAERWSDTMESTLRGLPWAFIGFAPYHTLSLSNDGMVYGRTGSTYYDLIVAFWTNDRTRQIFYNANIIDS